MGDDTEAAPARGPEAGSSVEVITPESAEVAILSGNGRPVGIALAFDNHAPDRRRVYGLSVQNAKRAATALMAAINEIERQTPVPKLVLPPGVERPQHPIGGRVSPVSITRTPGEMGKPN